MFMERNEVLNLVWSICVMHCCKGTLGFSVTNQKIKVPKSFFVKLNGSTL